MGETLAKARGELEAAKDLTIVGETLEQCNLYLHDPLFLVYDLGNVPFYPMFGCKVNHGLLSLRQSFWVRPSISRKVRQKYRAGDHRRCSRVAPRGGSTLQVPCRSAKSRAILTLQE